MKCKLPLAVFFFYFSIFFSPFLLLSFFYPSFFSILLIHGRTVPDQPPLFAAPTLFPPLPGAPVQRPNGAASVEQKGGAAGSSSPLPNLVLSARFSGLRRWSRSCSIYLGGIRQKPWQEPKLEPSQAAPKCPCWAHAPTLLLCLHYHSLALATRPPTRPLSDSANKS